MAPRIYTSPAPSLPVASTSLFTYLFSSDDPNFVGGYPGEAKAYIDAPSGTTLTRAQVKNLALSFAFGLRDHPNLAARRNDVILIYSQNSLHWPVVMLGSGMCRIER